MAAAPPFGGAKSDYRWQLPVKRSTASSAAKAERDQISDNQCDQMQ